MPFNKSNSSSEDAELKNGKAQKTKNNKNVPETKDDKKKNKCKNECEPSPDVVQVSKRQKVAPQVSNAASAAKLMKKSKITEESNATATAKQKPVISVTPNVPGGAKQMESSSGQQGYKMPKSFGECVVDEWFTRKHGNSFSKF